MLLIKLLRLVALTGLLGGLAACATDADQYYSLQPSASQEGGVAAVQRANDTFDYVVSVQPVVVPSQLDRSQIVLKGGSGDVSILNASLWASALPDEIRLAVSSYLTGVLGVPDLPFSGVPEGLSAWVVYLDVQRFDLIYNDQGIIDLTWRLQHRQPQNGQNSPSAVCRATVAQPVGPGLAPLVKAQRQGLQALAGLVAQQISHAQAQPSHGIMPPELEKGLPGLVFQGCARSSEPSEP